MGRRSGRGQGKAHQCRHLQRLGAEGVRLPASKRSHARCLHAPLVTPTLQPHRWEGDAKGVEQRPHAGEQPRRQHGKQPHKQLLAHCRGGGQRLQETGRNCRLAACSQAVVRTRCGTGGCRCGHGYARKHRRLRRQAAPGCQPAPSAGTLRPSLASDGCPCEYSLKASRPCTRATPAGTAVKAGECTTWRPPAAARSLQPVLIEGPRKPISRLLPLRFDTTAPSSCPPLHLR